MPPSLSYPVDQSPLYRLSNKKRMLALLGASAAEWSELRRRKGYSCFQLPDRYASSLPALKHKPRDVQSPEEVLKRVQKRLSELLSRIDLPDYLHSARKGYSYKSNASRHLYGMSLAKIDIRKFYESTHISFVYRYFVDVLQCSPDVAHHLADVSTYKNRLPTGSPLSPILSFLAYRSMFEELFDLAMEAGLTMTVYVDDVVVSGPGFSSRFIEPAQKVITGYRLRAHKFSTTVAGSPLVVTGVSRGAAGDSAPPGRFRKIRALQSELEMAKTAERKVVFLRALVGQYREGKSLIPNALSHADKYQRQLDALPKVPSRPGRKNRMYSRSRAARSLRKVPTREAESELGLSGSVLAHDANP